MRDYSKVGPQFWTGETGRRIRSLGLEARVVATYLLTSPHANMLGLYYCPLAYIANDCGITTEGASESLQSLSEVGFCKFDSDSECVWVLAMAKFQIGERLEPADNRCKAVAKEYAALPNNMFLLEFHEKYGGPFHIASGRTHKTSVQAPSQAPSKPRTGAGEGTRAEAGTGSGANPVSAAASAPGRTVPVWTAYSAAYRKRYGAEPTRNAKVNGMLGRFMDRVPVDEAPDIAAFYVNHSGRFYVQSMHKVDLLLSDAEKLRTEWQTGRRMTGTEARNAEAGDAVRQQAERVGRLLEGQS